ncbi:MAG: MCE family protein [Hyphomonadaceae bacterium]|nr:MCE family protein [Hyphomonadaceae bacterium]
METRANYALLGGVTVGAVVLVMLFAMWLARASFNREFATYDVAFDGAARGIGAGTEVRFNGIRVGEVRRLFMDPDNENGVIARIRIGADWPVRTDSVARLEPIGLTGLNLIQITPGAEKSEQLEHRIGQPPPRIAAKGAALDELLESSSTIAENATQALAGARDILNTENAARIDRILVNLEKISQNLAAERGAINNVAAAAEEWRAAGRSLQATAREVEMLSAETRTRFATLEASANTAFGAINQAAIGVEGAAGAASGSTLPDLSNAANDMRRLAVTLDRVAGNLERSRTLNAVGEQKRTVKVDP